MSFVKISDHEKDGKTDWTSYHKAQIQNGEICTSCGKYIIWGNGYPTQCPQCKDLDSSNDQIYHERYIRCPKCKHTFDPYETEHYDVLNDGDHTISCHECDHEFEITTMVSYTFRSPALLDQPEEKED